MEKEMRRVCVTGAGGFVASWIVKLLLSEGYVVHGTIRAPENEKYTHLNKLEGATDNLKLFKADLLDYDSLRSAIAGCAGVFHVACPVPISPPVDPEADLLEPAVKGTLNVLRACSDAKVERVVYLSSVAAVARNPNWPKNRIKDETCWSDAEYCRATESWYHLAKTEAELAAFEYGKQNGLNVVSVNPGFVFGPVMQPELNFSTSLLVKLMKSHIPISAGSYTRTERASAASAPNNYWNIVDVRDVAGAVLLAYEKPEAEGRYICVSHGIMNEELLERLMSLEPSISRSDDHGSFKPDNRVTSEKLRRLGWTYRPLEETLADSIQSYREAALLD